MLCPVAYGAEHVTLRNGFEIDCVRQETTGDRVRLYLLPAAEGKLQAASGADSANYIEVSSASVVRVETMPEVAVSASASVPDSTQPSKANHLTPDEMRDLLDRLGRATTSMPTCCASVIHAESERQRASPSPAPEPAA